MTQNDNSLTILSRGWIILFSEFAYVEQKYDLEGKGKQVFTFS